MLRLDYRMTKSGSKSILSRIDQRLRALAPPGEKQLSDNAASLRCGLSRDGIRTIRRQLASGRQYGIRTDTLQKLAAGLETTEQWLLREEGPEYVEGARTVEDHVNRSQGKARSVPPNSVGEVRDLEFDGPTTEVPEIEITAGAGYAGGFNQEENSVDRSGRTVSRDVVRTNWGIPEPFLRSELHIRGGQAHILPVRGDSMVSALFDGDRAIVNLGDKDISQGGIFALLDDNASLIIKQVEIVRGSNGKRIRCTSRNPAYAPFELELTDPVAIVGRIAGKITRL